RRSTSSSSAASEGVGATARCRITGAFAQAANTRQRSAVAFRMENAGRARARPAKALEGKAQTDLLPPAERGVTRGCTERSAVILRPDEVTQAAVVLEVERIEDFGDDSDGRAADCIEIL